MGRGPVSGRDAEGTVDAPPKQALGAVAPEFRLGSSCLSNSEQALKHEISAFGWRIGFASCEVTSIHFRREIMFRGPCGRSPTGVMLYREVFSAVPLPEAETSDLYLPWHH
jgi:hypothetical protein